jgi:aminopeptidase YwaD
VRTPWVVAATLAVLLSGCTDEESPDPGPATVAPSASPSPTAPPAPPAPPADPSTAPTDAAPLPRVSPDDVRVGTAMAAVRHLAGRIGPRPGTSPAYFQAERWVKSQLSGLGWRVERDSFHVPAGFSVAGPTDGLPVAAGRSVNLVATRGDVVTGQPWLLVGAHLDTVPTAPGAEDNASGIGVLLATAEALAGHRTRLPVVLVAFGAEEPRGRGETDHHYGSRAFVERLSPAQRSSLRGMVALDRVGVGAAVPLGSVGAGDPLRAELERAARRAGVPVVTETGQTSSDHASFVAEGMPGVRLGSTPYAGYHSAGDVPSVVDPAQLGRTARVVVEWLR